MDGQHMAPDPGTVKALEEALRSVFGEGQERQRFIDITRIPLICQSILRIEDTLSALNDKVESKSVTQDQFAPVRNLVYGLAALILTGAVTAVLALIYKAH